MKKKIYILILIALPFIVWWGIKYHSSAEKGGIDPIWVETSTVQETSFLQEAHLVGSLSASRSIEITPEFAGHVQKIFFQDGAFVKQGMSLIQLDDAVFKAKHESAEAKYVYSEHNFKRLSILGKKGIITQQAIDQAEADLKEKKADAEESAVVLEKMNLTAPFDGVVGKRKINLGDYVTVGQSLVTITDIIHLRVDYNIPEKFLPHLQKGQEVKVTTSAYPGKVFSAKVAFISPTINTDNRSVSLYADLSNENNLLKPGMFVNVTQSLGSEEHALMIPSRSLVPMLDGEQVYKVVDGKAYAGSVIVGKRSNDKVQVLQGLSPGDIVITDGQMKLKNGVSVKIKS